MLPQLRELEQRFGDAIAVVGVHSGKYTAERITDRIRDASIRLGAAHPVLNDRQFRVWRAYAVRAWPTLVAIDPRGAVIGMSAGEFTADGVTPSAVNSPALIPMTAPFGSMATSVGQARTA